MTDSPSKSQGPSQLGSLEAFADLMASGSCFCEESGIVSCCRDGDRSNVKKYRFVAKLIATI